MELRLKRLADQVIVITGATGGMGLATAWMAAARGARVVLAARDAGALEATERKIADRGGAAVSVVTDVAVEDDMRKVADAAVGRFGGFDTWVNAAGESICGRIAEVPLEDQRRLFDTNYWDVVVGSRIAVEHLRRRGGALINIGSVLSDRALPLQGPYSASKHAVKGFTDALRMELEEEGAPVSVTLVKPAAIETYERHARNDPDAEPGNPVAEAVLHAAGHPVRDLVVAHGRRGHVRQHGFYTRSAMHPLAMTAVVAGVGALAAVAISRGRPVRGPGDPSAAAVPGHGRPVVGVLGIQGPDDPLEDRYGAAAME